MALKIRLRKQGRTNRAFYRLVVADSRYPRDGKYLEALGWYNPVEAEADKQTFVKPDRLQHWLSMGAQLSDNVVALLKRIEPGIVRTQVQKEVAHRAKAAVKRKEKKQVKA